MSDLRAGDLLGRVMAALLPRETADGGTADDDTAVGWEDLPVVLDPACGEGAALLAVADRFGDRVRLAGQELDPGLAKAAALRLSGDVSGAVYEIHVGDSLLDDQLAPYLGRPRRWCASRRLTRRAGRRRELTADPRWEFGIPAPRDGELAWVQHCLRTPAAARRRRRRRITPDLRTAVRGGHPLGLGPLRSAAGGDRVAAEDEHGRRHGRVPVDAAAASGHAGRRAGANDRPFRAG